MPRYTSKALLHLKTQCSMCITITQFTAIQHNSNIFPPVKNCLVQSSRKSRQIIHAIYSRKTNDCWLLLLPKSMYNGWLHCVRTELPAPQGHQNKPRGQRFNYVSRVNISCETPSSSYELWLADSIVLLAEFFWWTKQSQKQTTLWQI